jgi:hypothetical protein
MATGCAKHAYSAAGDGPAHAAEHAFLKFGHAAWERDCGEACAPRLVQPPQPPAAVQVEPQPAPPEPKAGPIAKKAPPQPVASMAEPVMPAAKAPQAPAPAPAPAVVYVPVD